MTFNTGTGFTQVNTDSGTATITAAKPNLEIVGGTNADTSASGNTITVNNTASGGGGWVLLNCQTTDGADTEIVFDNTYITDTYSTYVVTCNNYTGTGNGMQVSTDNGSTWETTNYQGDDGGGTGSGRILTVENDFLQQTDGADYACWIWNPTDSSIKTKIYAVGVQTADQPVGYRTGGWRDVAEDNDAIRFVDEDLGLLGADTVYCLYGIAKS